MACVSVVAEVLAAYNQLLIVLLLLPLLSRLVLPSGYLPFDAGHV